MKKALILLTIFTLTGCATSNPDKPYTNQYGAFASPIDADCAYLVYPKEPRESLGDKYEKELNQCKEHATAKYAAGAKYQNTYARNTNTQGMGKIFSNAFTQVLAHQEAMRRQQAQNAQAIRNQQPTMTTTNCSVGRHVGGAIAGSRSVNCTTW